MKLSIATLAAAVTFAAGSAFAFHCPADMAKIDAALAKNPEAHRRPDGRGQEAAGRRRNAHKAGKHQESVDTLAKAMKTLNVQ